MYGQFKNGQITIVESSVKLRSKFVKKFPNLWLQENVIQAIEDLKKSSVLDVFKFLMQASANKNYLAEFTHLGWANLTDDQSKIIWNEIRSQLNQTFKLFPEADVFENTCEPFVKIWEDSTFDLAIDFFKKMVTYLDAHHQDEIKRVLYLLESTSGNYNAGAFREIGYQYKEISNFLKFHYQAFCLMDGLHMNNCYMAAVPLLPYFGEIDQPKKIEAEETSIFEIEPKAPESNVNFEAEVVTAEVQKKTLEFTFDEMIRFIKNYELFKGFFVAVGGVRELGIEPQFVLEHEKEFFELLDTIDLHFQKR